MNTKGTILTISKKQEELNTELFYSCHYNDMQKTKDLIKKGADINKAAMMDCAREGHLDMIKFLVQNNAEIDPVYLCTASSFGQLSVVQFFVEQGINPNVKDGKPLIYACESGELDIVNFLLHKGANPHLQLDEALRRSILNKHFNITLTLLNHINKDHYFNNYLPQIPKQYQLDYLINNI